MSNAESALLVSTVKVRAKKKKEKGKRHSRIKFVITL